MVRDVFMEGGNAFALGSILFFTSKLYLIFLSLFGFFPFPSATRSPGEAAVRGQGSRGGARAGACGRGWCPGGTGKGNHGGGRARSAALTLPRMEVPSAAHDRDGDLKDAGDLEGNWFEVCEVKRRHLTSLSSFMIKGRANASAVPNIARLEGKSDSPAELLESFLSCQWQIVSGKGEMAV